MLRYPPEEAEKVTGVPATESGDVIEFLTADGEPVHYGTPLIRLRRLSEETGCEILGKAEWMNPGGSVKDRAARFIVYYRQQHKKLDFRVVPGTDAVKFVLDKGARHEATAARGARPGR